DTVTMVMNGNQDNGSKLMVEDDWTPVLGGDGMECAISPHDPDIMWGEVYYGTMYRSTNGGNNWQEVNSGVMEDGAWVSPFVVDETIPGRMWRGTTRIYRSDNNGSNWEDMTGSISGNRIRSLAIAPSNSDVVYGADHSGNLWVTEDAGDNWTYHSAPRNTTTYLAVHPNNENILWATVGGYTSGTKVYYSTDGGNSWENRSGDLPNLPFNCVVVHPYNPSHIYVGCDVGVFFSDDHGLTWQDYSTGLPNVIVTELTIHANSNALVAATYGRGNWVTPAEEVILDPTLTLDSPNGGEQWLVGNEVAVLWHSLALEGDLTIELNRGYPDGDWEVVDDEVENDNRYEFTLTGPSSQNARVRISTNDMEEQVSDVSDASFMIVTPAIQMTSPNGGESWEVGDQHTISWESEYVEGNIRLEINRDYPDGEWAMFVQSIPNLGQIPWEVNGPATEHARFRITALEFDPPVSDTCDGDFEITYTPTIVVEQPNGGEEWELGSEHTVQWDDNIPEAVEIHLLDGAAEAGVISEGTMNNGNLSWDIPDLLLPGSDYRVVVGSSEDETIADTSDAPFMLSMGVPVLSYPGDEAVVEEPPLAFGWEEAGGAETYTLQIADDDMFGPGAIVHQADGIAELSVEVEGLPNGLYYWRVRAIHNAGMEGEWSDARSFTQDIAGLDELSFDGVPDDFAIAATFPNPFNNSTRIVTALPQSSNLRVSVYNIMGREVTRLNDGPLEAGYHTFMFDASTLSSGVYFVRAEAPVQNWSRQRRIVLLK
ncbi:T9SS type A sorting domain-containing protein, partial [bacterium]|nr:T9SS type A sorting domain-containing protein [bacterium]